MEDFGISLVDWWVHRLTDLRVAAVSFLVLTVLTRFTWKSIVVRYTKQIPEPPAWPVIGHLHLFGKLPHQILMKLSRRYGPLMSIRLGSLRLVVASNAEMAREFLKTHDAVWASRAPTHFGEFFFYNYNDVVTQPLNDFWRKMKKIYYSEFLSATNVEKQKTQRHESTVHLVNSLLESASHGGNRPLEVYSAVAHMNFYHMRRLIFGKRLSLEYTDCASTREKKKTLAQMIRDVTTVDILSLGDCFPWLRWLDLDGVERKLKKIHTEFDTFVSELLEQRRRQLLDGVQDDESEDLARALQSLVDKEDGNGLTSDNIKGTIADMFAAGVETTAGVVTLAVAEIMRHPEVKLKLLRELDEVVGRERIVTESDLVNLSYLKMVFLEALRLYPSIPVLIHCSNASSVVAGYHIPAGTQVLLNVYAIQRDPKSWEDPLAFKPERFTDRFIDARGQHFELLPFGSGRRQCPGMNMGVAISELVLARLFQTLDISLPPGTKPEDVDMTEARGTTLGLATPLRVVVSPRLPPELYTIRQDS